MAMRAPIVPGTVFMANAGLPVRSLQTGRTSRLAEQTRMTVERVSTRGVRGNAFLVAYEQAGQRQRDWVDARDIL
jgi:hypothetical protein